MGEYNKQNEYEEKNKRAEGKTLRTNISQHAYSICFGFYLTTKHLRIISFPLKKKNRCIVASNSSDDGCLDSPNGPVEIYG